MSKTVAHVKDWFNCSVIYKAFVSRDGPDIVYASDGETIDCYISGHTKLFINEKGEEIVSNQQLFIDSDDITITDQYSGIFEIDSRDRPIKMIENFYDEDGNKDLIVVYL